MRLAGVLLAALSVCGTAQAAQRGSPWLRLRGGAADNVGSQVRRKADNVSRDVQREAREVRAEQIVPLAVGLVGIAQGLDMLINPQRTSRFFDRTAVVTDTDKTSVAMIGARELVRGLAIAGIATRSDDNSSLQLANALALSAAVVDEGVDQLAVRAEGFRAVSSKHRPINTAFRVLVSSATLWTLWALRGKPDPLDNY